jgi:hypothetical protein
LFVFQLLECKNNDFYSEKEIFSPFNNIPFRREARGEKVEDGAGWMRRQMLSQPSFGDGRAALFARKLSPAALELCYSYPGAVLQSLCKVAPGLLEKVYGGLGKILRTAAPSPPTAHLSSTKATACGHSSPDIKEEGCNPMGYSLRTMSVFLCLIQALQCA